jgi:penicillin-binding protein 1C
MSRLRRLRRWQKIVLILLVLLGVATSGGVVWVYHDLPSIDQIRAGMALPSTYIYDRKGRLLYEVIDPQGGRHAPIDLAKVPNSLIKATIATEDRNFYSTPGIDLEGMLRALWINLQGGEIRAGGSTITQQVARNLLLDPQQRAERSIRRKLREMALALQISGRYSRDEILALYFNQTYYGNMAYGVQAAANLYFGKDIAQLSLAESALLAGLPQSPATYDPLTNPEAAKKRQRVVLDLMVVAGYLNVAEADLAFAVPLEYGSGLFTMNAPHFVQLVWAQIERDYGQYVYEGGLVITTTLDLDWQNTAEQIARRQLEKLNTPQPGKPANNARGAALVAIDPQTGQVLTLLGSPDYYNEDQSGAINMATTPRQPGSTLKPFTFALSFDPFQSEVWTPAKMILDVSTPFITAELSSYTPANYGLVEHGPVLIREALASSYNIPATVALQKVGIRTLTDLLHKSGISTLNNPERLGLSISLGGGEIRLNELTAAYAMLANGGRPIETSLLLSVQDKAGNTLYQWQQPAPTNPILDEKVAWLITDILSDNEARLPSFGASSPLQIGRPAAVKTGTTTDYRDNWTVGYTPQVVVGVWVGNPDNQPMINVSGVTGAGPIWNEFMRTVLKDQPERTFTRPDGLVQAEVCALSGLLPTNLCPKKRVEWFIRGTIPTEYDNLHQRFEIDTRTGLLADLNTPPTYKRDKVYLVLPQEAWPWARRNGIELPPISVDTAGRSRDGVYFIAPDPYTIFQLSPLLPFDSQKVRFATALPAGSRTVEYWLNDSLLARAEQPPYDFWWALIPGQYTLQAKAVLADGSTQASAPLYFSVVSYVPPDSLPASGNLD